MSLSKCEEKVEKEENIIQEMDDIMESTRPSINLKDILDEEYIEEEEDGSCESKDINGSVDSVNKRKEK